VQSDDLLPFASTGSKYFRDRELSQSVSNIRIGYFCVIAAAFRESALAYHACRTVPVPAYVCASNFAVR
jgi:hypothetical protein